MSSNAGSPSSMTGSGRDSVPGVVRSSSRMFGSGLEPFLDVQKWSGGPLGDREAGLNVREWSGASWMSVSGWVAFPHVR